MPAVVVLIKRSGNLPTHRRLRTSVRAAKHHGAYNHRTCIHQPRAAHLDAARRKRDRAVVRQRIGEEVERGDGLRARCRPVRQLAPGHHAVQEARQVPAVLSAHSGPSVLQFRGTVQHLLQSWRT